MPVFDFSDKPVKNEDTVCTYTAFQSNAKEKTPEEPILVLDNSERQWIHHALGVFTNPAKRTAFEFKENGETFSADIQQRLIPDFLDYGVQLKRFYVTTVVKPDGDPQYEKFKELHFRQYADIAEAKLKQQTDVIHAQTEAQKVVIDSQAQATKRMQEGYTYQQERGFDVAQDAAKNEGAGQFSNMGIGQGMMAAVGGTVGGIVGGAVSDAFAGVTMQPQTAANRFCDQCGAELTPGAAFCDECGAPQAAPDICAKCGFKFTKPGKFCPKCGAKREG